MYILWYMLRMRLAEGGVRQTRHAISAFKRALRVGCMKKPFEGHAVAYAHPRRNQRPRRVDGSQVIKKAVAAQIAEAMKAQSISKARMASLLNTSRSQVDRLLDPASDITLSTLMRAAALVGRRLHIQLMK